MIYISEQGKRYNYREHYKDEKGGHWYIELSMILEGIKKVESNKPKVYGERGQILPSIRTKIIWHELLVS